MDKEHELVLSLRVVNVKEEEEKVVIEQMAEEIKQDEEDMDAMMAARVSTSSNVGHHARPRPRPRPRPHRYRYCYLHCDPYTRRTHPPHAAHATTHPGQDKEEEVR